MKITKHITLFSSILALVLINSCEPNKELYELLDAEQVPYKKEIEYTLSTEDYNSFGGVIKEYQAFNDTLQAKDKVPTLLQKNFIALNLESSAQVTFHHLLLHPTWWDSGFGYELTKDDYDYIGVDGEFSEENPASQYLPFFLLKNFPEAEEDDNQNVIYKYLLEEETILNLDEYQFNGSEWTLLGTTENIPFVGYELTAEDYDMLGGDIADNNNFSETSNPDNYLPVFLKNKFPYDPVLSVRVVKYKFYESSKAVIEKIDKYVFNGIVWEKTSEIEERTEQYVYGEQGWAFDPTITYKMTKDDYMYIAVNDPIPHPTYNDFGYYYGASAYYGNFDIRLIGRRLNTNDDGTYWDPDLGEIFDTEGDQAAMEEMMRRIAEEGILMFLEYRFPDAVTQIGGIDVHYIVQFETFADGFIRRYPEAEYKCIGSNPAKFEFIELRGFFDSDEAE